MVAFSVSMSGFGAANVGRKTKQKSRADVRMTEETFMSLTGKLRYDERRFQRKGLGVVRRFSEGLSERSFIALGR